MNDYTEEQVKTAFWATFHKSGELWFAPEDDGYAKDGTRLTSERDTQNYWVEFQGHLRDGKPKERE